MTRPPALLFGVPIADVTMDETVAAIADLVAHGRATSRTHQVATVNVDFLVNALDHPDVRSTLQRAALCIADGMPIVWGAGMLGMPLRERVAGADLVPRLVEESQRLGWHVHIFGSCPEVAEASTRLLRERFPAARFSIDPGPMIPDVAAVDREVIDSIRSVDADIVCIALGNPKQERFIAAHGRTIGAPVMIGVGGSLDMLVGKRRRAPQWVQRIGLEWVVRAAQEPGRLGRRYTRDIRVFGPRLLAEWRVVRRRRNAAGLNVLVGSSTVDVMIGGAGMPSAQQFSLAASQLAEGFPLVVGFDHGEAPAEGLRHDAVAQLIGLVTVARRGGAGAVRWHEPPSAADRRSSLEGFETSPDLFGLDDSWECQHSP